MADVEDLYRCDVCGQPITNEQNFVIIPKFQEGEEVRAHSDCVGEEEQG
jgi:hypothetical protein